MGGQIIGNPKGWQLMGALVRGTVPMPQPDPQTLQALVWDRVVIGGTMSNDGVYELEGIPPGTYTAIVWTTPAAGEAEGFKQASGEVVVNDGDEVVILDLTLE
ncbi:MAG: carboxypeptidase regulatory-like domain-containing protein [Candidatus Hydrogenedentes bacterium]|nr:carboxypeptidase regulatory-like domain-containing protein [Candidatus Hydrogenedentota bacterium]